MMSVHPKMSNYSFLHMWMSFHWHSPQFAAVSLLCPIFFLPLISKWFINWFPYSWEAWRYQITLPKTQCVAFTKFFNFFVSISKIIIKWIHTQILPSEGIVSTKGNICQPWIHRRMACNHFKCQHQVKWSRVPLVRNHHIQFFSRSSQCNLLDISRIWILFSVTNVFHQSFRDCFNDIQTGLRIDIPISLPLIHTA